MKKKVEHMKWFWEGLDEYLRERQLKSTKQRNLVIQTFVELQGHVDVEMLYKATQKKDRAIGIATVYRTLSLLVDANLAIEQTFVDGRALYEIRYPDEHHDHLVCITCGTVLEFTNDEIEKLQENVAKTLGFKLKSHRLDMYGECQKADCKNRGSAK